MSRLYVSKATDDEQKNSLYHKIINVLVYDSLNSDNNFHVILLKRVFYAKQVKNRSKTVEANETAVFATTV